MKDIRLQNTRNSNEAQMEKQIRNDKTKITEIEPTSVISNIHTNKHKTN